MEEITRKRLENNGWYPDRCIDIAPIEKRYEEIGLTMPDNVKSFLRSFGMLEITFRILKFHDGSESLIMDLPKEIDLVATFLSADVQRCYYPSGEAYLNILDRVLNGEVEYMEYGGNVCGLEVTKEKTRVIDTLAEDGVGDACEIETDELRELVKIWLDEQEKFRNKSQKS